MYFPCDSNKLDHHYVCIRTPFVKFGTIRLSVIVQPNLLNSWAITNTPGRVNRGSNRLAVDLGLAEPLSTFIWRKYGKGDYRSSVGR